MLGNETDLAGKVYKQGAKGNQRLAAPLRNLVAVNTGYWLLVLLDALITTTARKEEKTPDHLPCTVRPSLI